MVSIIIGWLASFVIAGISFLGYSGVALMMAIESACIPLPSEIIMPFSGYLVSQGRFTLAGITLAGALGSLLGSLMAYWIGYWGGRAFFEKYGKYILISRHDLNLADNFFEKYGAAAVFFSRMLPVIRTFISLPAGITRMNHTKFIVYTFLGSLPWCWLLGYAGEKMGENWEILGGYFHKFDAVIGGLIVLGAIWFVRRHLKQRD